ncbi:MAG: ferrous iron transporter B, partial [Dehalococcoidales bacterium]|nr:ferrous iron transporter B [Dehalococcoidales bacterium]
MIKEDSKKITIALAGNPNSGKTTIFNNITGSHQHVGNWPGVTVEKKDGFRDHHGYNIKVVDLPGVYSLTAYSPDEVVSRNFIVDDKPDVVVNTIDASNLERNLYLTVQILEMGAPLIIALNMMDMVEATGHHINVQALSEEIGARVVPMTASHNKGTDDLLKEIIDIYPGKQQHTLFKLNYGHEAETEIAKLEKVIENSPISQKYIPRWLAVKLLEQDEDIIKKFKKAGTAYDDIIKAKEDSIAHLQSIYSDDAESIIADARYGFISGLLKDVLKKPPVERLTISDNIDKVLVNRWLGMPVL